MLSNLISGRQVTQYSIIVGMTWDGKLRGGDEIARRIKGEWVLTGKEYVMLATKPMRGEVANDWKLGTTAKQGRLIRKGYNGHHVLPLEALKTIGIGTQNFSVLMIPVFVSVRLKGHEKFLCGCFGYDPMYDEGVLVSVGPDDPMLSGISFSVVHVQDAVEEEVMPNAPAYTMPEDARTREEKLVETNQMLTVLNSQLEEVSKKEDDDFEAFGLAMKISYLEDRIKLLEGGVDGEMGYVNWVKEEANEKDVELKRNSSKFKAPVDQKFEDLKKKEEALRAFAAEKEKLLEGLDFAEVDGKRVLWLKHIPIKKGKFGEEEVNQERNEKVDVGLIFNSNKA